MMLSLFYYLSVVNIKILTSNFFSKMTYSTKICISNSDELKDGDIKSTYELYIV